MLCLKNMACIITTFLKILFQRNASNPNPKHVRSEIALTSGGKKSVMLHSDHRGGRVRPQTSSSSQSHPPLPLMLLRMGPRPHHTSPESRVRLVSFRLVSYQSASSQHAANRNEEKWKWARSSLNWSSTASQQPVQSTSLNSRSERGFHTPGNGPAAAAATTKMCAIQTEKALWRASWTRLWKGRIEKKSLLFLYFKELTGKFTFFKKNRSISNVGQQFDGDSPQNETKPFENWPEEGRDGSCCCCCWCCGTMADCLGQGTTAKHSTTTTVRARSLARSRSKLLRVINKIFNPRQ